MPLNSYETPFEIYLFIVPNIYTNKYIYHKRWAKKSPSYEYLRNPVSKINLSFYLKFHAAIKLYR